MEENIVDFYYDRLVSSEVPEKVLAEFYWKLQSVFENAGDINLFKDLVELFGRGEVFFLILDVVSYYGKELEKSRDKKKIFLKSMSMRSERRLKNKQVVESLDSFLTERKDRIERYRKGLHDR